MTIFHALELRHRERVYAAWAKFNKPEIIQQPFEGFVSAMAGVYKELLQDQTCRIVFMQYFTSPAIFQNIDESFTQEAIDFMAKLLQQRNRALIPEQCQLLAEVCVHACNTLALVALRSPESHRQKLFEQIQVLLFAYLRPHIGDEIGNEVSPPQVMKVMKSIKCPHCDSSAVSKNGHRHGKQRYICKECGKQFPESYSR